MSNSNTEKSNLHAVLIGIDCYLPNRLPDGGYYPSLGGCVRDIHHVEDFLKKFLLSKYTPDISNEDISMPNA